MILMNEKEYQKTCKKWNLYPYTPEERKEVLDRLLEHFKKNEYRLHGFTNYHNTCDDIHSKKVTLQYIDYSSKPIQIRNLSGLHLLSLGIDVSCYLKEPYASNHYFYVGGYGTNRIELVIQKLNELLFDRKYILSMY